MQTQHPRWNPARARAFLEIPVDQRLFQLPPSFCEVLQPHMSSTPTSLLLPWNPYIAMPEGKRYSAVHVPGLRVFFADERCESDLEEGIIRWVTTTVWDGARIDQQTMFCLGQQGYLLEDFASIREVLEYAGLYRELALQFAESYDPSCATPAVLLTNDA